VARVAAFGAEPATTLFVTVKYFVVAEPVVATLAGKLNVAAVAPFWPTRSI
jgi:hypothetical protein